MTDELQVRFVKVLYYHGGTGWNYKGVIWPYNTIYIVLDGDGHISSNGQTTDLLPGCVYLIPSGLRHNIWCDTHIEKIFVDAYVERIKGYDVFKGITEVLSLPFGLENCKKIRELNDGDMRAHLQLRGELLSLIAKLMPEEPKPFPPKIISLLPIIDYIEGNLSMKLKRDEIAQEFGWNQTVLSRTFSHVFGFGIKQYIDMLLSSRIAEELLLTDKTIRQMAEEFGFCDAYYLSDFFKRSFRMSPMAYRRLHRPETSAPACSQELFPSLRSQ